MDQGKVVGILSGEDRSTAANLWRMGLSAAEPFYRTAVWLRNKSFDTGFRESVDLGRPAISVGNLTTGGTGKTPVTANLVSRLQQLGRRPAILLRGYRAVDGQSDETRELGSLLGGAVPVEPNPDRSRAALSVIERDPAVECFVLDDGFQHRQAGRVLDVVLIDSTNPFGFDRMLPRGLLREPLTCLQRADCVIVTRSDQVSPEILTQVDQRVQQLTGQPPLAHTAHHWTALRQGTQTRPLSDLAQLSVVGVCGIGNPEQFRRMLVQTAGHVIHCKVNRDHHAYTVDEPRHLLTQAKAEGADALVLPEKDWVKWQAISDHQSQTPDGSPTNIAEEIPVLRPALEIDWLDGSDAVDKLLHQFVNSSAL